MIEARYVRIMTGRISCLAVNLYLFLNVIISQRTSSGRQRSGRRTLEREGKLKLVT